MNPAILQITELMGSLLQAKVLTDEQGRTAHANLQICLDLINRDLQMYRQETSSLKL